MQDDYEKKTQEDSMSVTRTSAEWQMLYPDQIVMDPDGWDRVNYIFSWYEELITRDEYFKRRMSSTCRWNKPKEE